MYVTSKPPDDALLTSSEVAEDQAGFVVDDTAGEPSASSSETDVKHPIGVHTLYKHHATTSSEEPSNLMQNQSVTSSISSVSGYVSAPTSAALAVNAQPYVPPDIALSSASAFGLTATDSMAFPATQPPAGSLSSSITSNSGVAVSAPISAPIYFDAPPAVTFSVAPPSTTAYGVGPAIGQPSRSLHSSISSMSGFAVSAPSNPPTHVNAQPTLPFGASLTSSTGYEAGTAAAAGAAGAPLVVYSSAKGPLDSSLEGLSADLQMMTDAGQGDTIMQLKAALSDKELELIETREAHLTLATRCAEARGNWEEALGAKDRAIAQLEEALASKEEALTLASAAE
eukprot:CAMPEP_0118953096 /NCGR_PEP_ID=MMETSP1169-20130426/55956_1 /TAXON_ID=36882 /ORGANISM="Pyramimonas obovata, Strain CCMP722" /LENGTH=340 /DNA_ID=CAMNT_0006900467 /DNA_START=195 /DNA_END=1214 /DNA_ORIENTATION=+